MTKLLGEVDAVLQKSQRSNPFVTHIDKIKLCYGSTPASWLKVKEREEAGEPLSNLSVGDGGFAGDEIAVGDKGPSTQQDTAGQAVEGHEEEDEPFSNLSVGDGSFVGDEIAVGDKGPSAQQDGVNQAVSEIEQVTMHSPEEQFVREEVDSDAVREDAGIDGLIAQHGSARQEGRGGGETPEGDEEWLWPRVERYGGDGHGEGSAWQGSGERESARPRRNAPKPARYRD